MPKCPKCGRPMASVLKREGGVVRMYYECRQCPESAESEQQVADEIQRTDELAREAPRSQLAAHVTP